MPLPVKDSHYLCKNSSTVPLVDCLIDTHAVLPSLVRNNKTLFDIRVLGRWG